MAAIYDDREAFKEAAVRTCLGWKPVECIPRTLDLEPFQATVDKGSPLDNLAGANLTDLRGFVLVRKRCCAGTPKRR